MIPDLALAASAREWPDRLHRHLLDHGGGRVVARVMGADQATGIGRVVLLIDDISSFLTPRLVTLVRQSGSEVIGVFDPDDGPDAKRRLLECGISDVIESDASADEFVQRAAAAMSHRRGWVQTDTRRVEGAWSMAVAGSADGVGATEVAVSIAFALSTALRTTLVDLDPVWPSVAQRLDLPLHPNLRTAIDSVLHDANRISTVFHDVGSLSVVGGVADRGASSPISHTEVAMLLDFLIPAAQVLVADLGSLTSTFGAVISRFDSLALVGSGDPVGIVRLLRSIDRVLGLIDRDKLVVIVNKVPETRFHDSEVRSELFAAYPDLPNVVMPYDRRVTESMWDGTLTKRGRFARSIGRMTGLIEMRVER